MSRPDVLLWLDLETTGLDPDTLRIAEVAVVITDWDLNELAAGEWLCADCHAPWSDGDSISAPLFDEDTWERPAWDLAGTSGLLDDHHTHIANLWAVPNRAWIESAILDLLAGRTATIAGGGVASFDVPIIRRQMPRLTEQLSYWSIDVSQLGRFTEHILGRPDFVPPRAGAHRAMADVRESLTSARHWRTVLGGAAQAPQ